MTLPLKKGIIYGPVNSRRFGRSLGINLMPFRYKLCSFNCVYCHYGPTSKLTMTIEKYSYDLPAFQDVVAAIESTLKSGLEFDQITFSGNGEPTLYPQFPEIVDEVVRLRSCHRAKVRIALLSNSTGLKNQKVFECIPRIDLPVFKLDAGTSGTFSKINRPSKGILLADIVERLRQLEKISIQTVFVDGDPSNTSQAELEAYARLLNEIRPKEVQIYSIDRPVDNTGILLVPPERLELIASQLRKWTGITVTAFHAKQVRPLT